MIMSWRELPTKFDKEMVQHKAKITKNRLRNAYSVFSYSKEGLAGYKEKALLCRDILRLLRTGCFYDDFRVEKLERELIELCKKDEYNPNKYYYKLKG